MYQRRLGLGTGYPERRKRVRLRSLPALSTTEPAPGSILISNKSRLDLEQKQEMIRSWSVRREYYELLGSITRYTIVSLEPSTQSIDRRMEQNLGVQENRNEEGSPRLYRQVVYQRRLGLGTGYRERRKRVGLCYPPGTLDH